jgi:alkylhydroperoxidase family enzyme
MYVAGCTRFDAVGVGLRQAARAVFEERELVDLTIAIGLMNVYNRLAIGFRNTPQAVIEKAA